MEMPEEFKKKYLKEISTRLRLEGYVTAKESNGCMPVDWRGEELCLVTVGGGVRYQNDYLEREGAREAFERVVEMTSETYEYMCLMETAPDLKANGLGDGYKALADFNGAVLAGHPTSRGVQLITWEWDYNHQSMWQGHYFGGDFAKAKVDFALRANILQRDNLFSREQQAEVYRSILETLDSVYPLTDERRKLLETTAEQIERNVPNLQELVGASAQLEQEESNRYARGQELI